MRFYVKMLVIVLVLMAAIFPLPTIASPGNEILVTINGQQVIFQGQGPIIADGRTLVPVRGVFEVLGFYPEWDGISRTVTLTRDDYIVVLTIGSYIFTTNGVEHALDVPAQITADRALLPLYAVLTSIGYGATWDSATRTVVIRSIAEDDAQAIPMGFVRYASANYGFALYHPSYWVHFDDIGGEEAVIALLAEYYHGAMGLAHYMAYYDFTAQWLFELEDNAKGAVIIRVVPNHGWFNQNMIQDASFKFFFEMTIESDHAARPAEYVLLGGVTGAWLGENYFTLFMSDSTYKGSETSHFQANTVNEDYEFVFVFITSRGSRDVDLFKEILSTFRA